MLQNSDLILLLTELEEQGAKDAKKYIRQAIAERSVPLDALKFVNSCRQLDVVSFYEHIRRNHNEKKSPLYKNIVQGDAQTAKALTTLHALLLQVSLFGSKLEDADRAQFYKHVRAEEIADVLRRYYKEYNMTDVLKILKLIRADVMAFEYVNGRRELE